MTPSLGAKRRAMRAVLSALAGGGLTAATLGGPLATDAGAAGSAGASEATTTSAAAVPESPATEGTTTTSTTPPTNTVPTTTATAPTAPPPVAETPVVLPNKPKRTAVGPGASTTQTTAEEAKKTKKAAENSNVASSPEMVAEEGALAAVLASSQASVEALGFYRIPLFMLPIYKAAAVQYGVPWQILAAINEIETNYGTDLSVSSAGAEGWMQFEPSTWLGYGVDALDAGYADPYNPVDAVFAAARYLRAAGASKNLRGAILAYNHSEEYASSVLLRAKLISTYPKGVVATLTGLVDGRVPVNGHKLAWTPLPAETIAAPSSATGKASAASAGKAAKKGAKRSAKGAGATPATPGASAAVSPSAAAAGAGATGGKAVPATILQQFVELTTAPSASVLAVQDGRVLQIGHSKRLGKFVVLRDVYGDVFTYANLGSVAPSYFVPKPGATKGSSLAVKTASTHDPAPSQAASAGTQPLTLQVKTPVKHTHAKKPAKGAGQIAIPIEESVPAGMDRTRLYAHPGNPDAKAAAVVAAARAARRNNAGHTVPLRKGAVVSSGTILGRVSAPKGAQAGHLKFAVRPAGDASTVEAGPILANWAQLQKALHPEGSRERNALLGATASDAFLLSRSELERAVLSDPGITIYACGRHDISSGAVDKRVLALLTFLSRSGLQPTVSALRCGQSQFSSGGGLSAQYRGDAVAITAINGVPIARHQGPGTITDLTIRALLTVPAEYVPHEILSLMRYPGSANTHANRGYWNRISIAFAPASKPAALSAGATSKAAHSAKSGATASVPLVTTSTLSAPDWTALITRIGGLPVPKVAAKPTSAAIPDKAQKQPLPKTKRK
jgi:soluble lytic murein transglycosylase-like protein